MPSTPTLPGMEAPLFRLWIWSSRLLFVGPAFGADRHRHHAGQLCVGLRAPLRLRGDADAAWRQGRAFHVPPNHFHRFDADGTPCALLLVEAQSRECAHCCNRHGGESITAFEPDAALLTALNRLAAEGGSADQADAACLALLGADRPEGDERPAPVDERLRAVMQWVDARLDTDIRLSAAATAVGVSPSWLSHHFGDALGLPLRRYVVWRRLRQAVQASLDGATLTEAAHHAGFADAAHLSRSFRKTFGIAPSFLFQRGLRGEVVIGD